MIFVRSLLIKKKTKSVTTIKGGNWIPAIGLKKPIKAINNHPLGFQKIIVRPECQSANKIVITSGRPHL